MFKFKYISKGKVSFELISCTSWIKMIKSSWNILSKYDGNKYKVKL